MPLLSCLPEPNALSVQSAGDPGTAPPDTGLGGYENAGSADTERAVRAGVTSGLY